VLAVLFIDHHGLAVDALGGNSEDDGAQRQEGVHALMMKMKKG
jgi:hypothetical protein